jgi:hypothetical protein
LTTDEVARWMAAASEEGMTTLWADGAEAVAMTLMAAAAAAEEATLTVEAVLPAVAAEATLRPAARDPWVAVEANRPLRLVVAALPRRRRVGSGKGYMPFDVLFNNNNIPCPRDLIMLSLSLPEAS